MFFIWFVIPAFSPIDKPVKQRYDKEADRRTDGHRAYHGDEMSKAAYNLSRHFRAA